MKCYRNATTDEVVYEEESKEYALTKLGLMNNGKLIVIPRGEDGTYTMQQLENLEETIEWFYSGEWYKEEIEGVEESSVFELIEEECELEDV